MEKPQFSLRELAWLILLCSMAAGWFADHSRLSQALADAKEEEASLDIKVRICATYHDELKLINQQLREQLAEHDPQAH